MERGPRRQAPAAVREPRRRGAQCRRLAAGLRGPLAGGKWRVVVNGQEQGFSTPSAKGRCGSAPTARDWRRRPSGQQWSVVVDGKPGDPDDGIGEMISAPTAARSPMSPGRRAGAVVLNGRLQKPFDDIGGRTPVFSPTAGGWATSPGWPCGLRGDRRPAACRYEMVGYLTFMPDARQESSRPSWAPRVLPWSTARRPRPATTPSGCPRRSSSSTSGRSSLPGDQGGEDVSGGGRGGMRDQGCDWPEAKSPRYPVARGTTGATSRSVRAVARTSIPDYLLYLDCDASAFGQPKYPPSVS